MPWINKRKVGHPNKLEQQERSKRHNEKWNRYYQSPLWKKLRHWQITNWPLCADCAINGISRAAEHVHHRIPFSTGETEEEKMRLLLDPDNLVSLCESCHKKRHIELNRQNK